MDLIRIKFNSESIEINDDDFDDKGIKDELK
jgi:hypothetical protein